MLNIFFLVKLMLNIFSMSFDSGSQSIIIFSCLDNLPMSIGYSTTDPRLKRELFFTVGRIKLHKVLNNLNETIYSKCR